MCLSRRDFVLSSIGRAVNFSKLDQSFPKETSGNHWHLLSALNLTVVLLSPQVVGLLFSSQYGGSHQAPGSAHSGWHHGHQTLLLWPHHP